MRKFWGGNNETVCVLILMVLIQLYEFFKTHRTGQQRMNFTILKFKLKNFNISFMTFLILSIVENGMEKFFPFFQFEKW